VKRTGKTGMRGKTGSSGRGNDIDKSRNLLPAPPDLPVVPDLPDIIRDPLWDNIRLDPAALLALDTPTVQRLRYIRQVGHSFLVYPGATHSRTHWVPTI
jgi:hypothetical protein